MTMGAAHERESQNEHRASDDTQHHPEASDAQVSALEEFRQRVITLLSPYRGRISYGNLRYEEHEWNDNGHKVVDFSIVYETPGGSTNQITVTYNTETHIFTIVDGDPPQEIHVKEVSEVLKTLEHAVRQIPYRRIERLKANVRQWVASGKSRHELLQEINRLVRSDFKGGSITHQELKQAIQYCLKLSMSMEEDKRIS